MMGLFGSKKKKENGPDKDTQKLVSLLQERYVELVLDLGANVGQYAEQIRDGGYKGKIVSFEPLSQNHKVLEQKAGKDKNWQIAERMALGKTSGEIEMNVSQNSDMSSFLELEQSTLKALPKSKYVATEKTPLHTLDDVFGQYTAEMKDVFLKIDTQGAEMDILKGAGKSLERCVGLQLELSLLPLYKGEVTFDAITLWVRQKGFVPYMIIPGYFSKKLGRQLQIDIVFFRPPAAA